MTQHGTLDWVDLVTRATVCTCITGHKTQINFLIAISDSTILSM
jgi:hypothetical protein